jgi:hypothetical protein
MNRRYCLYALSGLAAAGLSRVGFADEPKKEEPAKEKKDDGAKWEPLFNGKNLDGWKKTNFGGEGEVTVDEGNLVIDMGSPLTGVHWKEKDPPYKTNYEIRLEAKRVKGGDFFVGLTFPVEDSHCSFIVGGWAGGVVGLSSINSLDASENGTTKYMEFKSDKWYKFRVKVTKEKIACWIDDEQVVDQELKDQKISTRIEVDASKPLGLATYETKSAIRKFEIRPVK